MKRHEFREHTADILFDAYGSSFAEAIEAAADALFETVADTGKIRVSREMQIGESAHSREDLAIFTLSRLLGSMDAEELFFKEFRVTSLKEEGGVFSLEGVVRGAPADPKIGRTVVKAVTHHITEVAREDGGWRIRLLLDI